MGITNPRGKERFVAAAFPSACGKTNMAMLLPTLPGWKVRVVGKIRDSETHNVFVASTFCPAIVTYLSSAEKSVCQVF